MLQSEIEWQKERKSRMTSKERAELKAQAMKLDSIFQIGKASLTPQLVEAVKDALAARELIKVSVLKNCADDPRELAEIVSERTGSQVVQVIGKKIVLYKEKRRRAQKLKAGEEKRKPVTDKAAGKKKLVYDKGAGKKKPVFGTSAGKRTRRNG